MTKKQNKLLFFALASVILVLDQLTKFLVADSLAKGQSISVIKNFFHITLIQNTGSAFGISAGIAIPIVLSFATIAIISYYYKDILKKKALAVFAALILSGAIGNLIDRIAFGFVRDFIDFRIWPAFNIADAALTIGVIGLIIYILSQKK